MARKSTTTNNQQQPTRAQRLTTRSTKQLVAEMLQAARAEAAAARAEAAAAQKEAEVAKAAITKTSKTMTWLQLDLEESEAEDDCIITKWVGPPTQAILQDGWMEPTTCVDESVYNYSLRACLSACVGSDCGSNWSYNEQLSDMEM